MSCVLDASALLALLLREPGCERVRGELTGASMTTVNLAEVIGYFARLGTAEADVNSVIGPLPFEHVSFDVDLAERAGMMLPLTRAAGLSLGDRACLALAARLGVRALTADRSWTSVGASLGVEVDLLR